VKTLATIFLGFVVVVMGFSCFWLSMCAIAGDGSQGGGSRGSYALADLVVIGIMVGAILLIAKINRKKPEPN
jgi:divalent metal cation (Fe/Co/Zn/Cd) transporter